MGMPVTIKTRQEIEILREGGQRLAQIVRVLCGMVKPGMTTRAIDDRVHELIAECGGQSAFLGYRPEGVRRKYPASVCVSVNDEIVHGIPGDRVIHTGDVVTIDCGLKYGGLFTDHAVTVAVGPVSKKIQSLIQDTHEALLVGIECIRPGATTGDIGHAIGQFVNKRYGIVRELAGHGVGYAVHEDPYVPNFGKPGTGTKLVPGMVLAIEPMLTIGKPAVVFHDDEYTVSTADRSMAAHFEHTVVVTDDGHEILTVE